jgi:hypothetical protein
MAAAFNGALECVKYLLSLPDIDLHCREYVSSIMLCRVYHMMIAILLDDG